MGEARPRFVRWGMARSAATAVGVSGALTVGAAQAPAASAAKAAACHITLRRSVGNMPATTVRFVNHDRSAVGVYWLNFTGFLVYYETITPGKSFTQSTFRSNAWVMLNPSFACVGYFVTGSPAQYVIK